MSKKFLIHCLAGLSFYFRAQAQLAITEVMTGEVDKNHPDWFELHNYGTSSINLTGYSWNDDAHGGFSGADTASFSGLSIAPGETIILTEPATDVATPADFRTWWGISPSIQVILLNAADPGLSKSGDSVRLWSTNFAALGSNTNGLDLDECSDFLVQRVDAGATSTQSLLYDPANGLYDLLSSNLFGGAFASTTGDIGSPGVAPSPVTAIIAQTPADSTITVGFMASFTNSGLGLPPLVFHWYLNNIPITSQTPGVSVYYINDTSVLTLSGPETSSAGTYTVTAIAGNGLQSFTNNATLTVNAMPTKPAIQSVTPALDSFDAYLGQTVNFSVAATGYPAPVYYWFKDNALISGQTSSQYMLSMGNTNQSGTYSVIVSNSVGSTNVSFRVNVTSFPNLVVTEVMSDESTNNSNGDTSGHGDWFELSNFGGFPVNLFGYRVDDSHDTFADATTITNHVTIHPGESVVFVQDMTPDQFHTWWGPNLPPGVQIIGYHGSGLSAAGDAINVWNAVAAVDDEVAAATFFSATNGVSGGVSFGFDPTFLNPGGFDGTTYSANGINGAFIAAVGGDVGSPGTILNVPRFTEIASHTGGGFQLSWFTQPNWTNIVQFKNNLADPNWTALTTVAPVATTNESYLDSTTSTQRFYRVILNIQN
jgi:hypothetical protein